ncbi:MAG: ABC transporter permease [Pseudomonadota bacterium]
MNEGILLRAGRVLMWGSVAFWIIFLVTPIVLPVLSSFTATEYLVFPPRGLSLRWYEYILDLQWFRTSLVTSLIAATVTTVLCAAIALCAARVIARSRGRSAALFEYLCLAPLVVPSVVFGFAFFNLLVQLNLRGLGILNLIVGHAVVTLPLMLRPIWASMQNADISLEEAAQSLGATPFETFMRITLPGIMPGIVAGCIVTFTYAFNDVNVAIFLTGPTLQTLPVELMSQIGYTPNASPAAVTSLIIVATIAVFFAIDRTAGMDVFTRK